MKNESANHQMRLSVDLRAVKEQEFTAQLSLRYAAVPALGLPAFRSPSLPLPNPRLELPLKDCFQTAYFQATAADMHAKLATIQIELWHCDRLRKDQLLGKATLELQKVVEMPLRRTAESYARVLDAYLPVDEVDDNGKPTRTVASLRVIVYLEDLGPADQLQQRGFKLNELLDESEPQELPRPSPAQGDGVESGGLNELERKVVWELETWKKAEEAKARLTLKQKEIEFWTNLSEQQRKSDLEKEKQFKKIEGALVLLEGKLRGKLAELAKREQKILLLEQELQTKIAEVSRECLLKDQEAEAQRRRHKEEKAAILKEKAQMDMELAKLRIDNARLRVELEELRKEDEKSPLNILRTELNAKALQLQELARELERATEVKEEYKLYYNKMREEVVTLRAHLADSEQAYRELGRERDLLQANHKHLEQQLAYERQLHQQQQQRPREDYQEEWPTPDNASDRERLLRQRETLIREAHYSANDPLIQELDRQIRSAS